ncbi:PPC domain-containing DNA-binding protein [Archaeoglobus neptunius]|uniref:PPC domain-containing DNA-binding protein n=1 Tax=Archaeoglobus neptunius TaxID=2798580 RepID=UPI001927C581|nr:PPC domain-containing DNA-binding protein [Archaeoglobus neptunius]
MKVFEFDRGLFLRLDYGRGIVEQLSSFLEEKNIQTALISGIGAVRNAEIGYYDQNRKEYVKRKIDMPMEILSLTGNVSLKDGKPFPHIHVVLGVDGDIYGGHLFEAEVFACELFLVALKGERLERHHDAQTGLYLWI